MNWYALLPLAAFLANLMLLILIYHRFKERRDRENVSFFFLMIFIMLWSLSHFITFTAGDAETAIRYNFIGVTSGLMTTVFMLYFSVNFAELSWLKEKKWPQYGLIAIAVTIAWLTMSTNLVNRGAHAEYWGFLMERGPLYTYDSLLTFILAVVSIAVALSVLSNDEMRHKHHSAWMYSFAFAFPVIGGLVTEIIAPILGIRLMPLSTVLSTVMALIVTKEILKNKFLGITPSMVSEIVVETMNDMLLVLNEDLRVAFVNRAMSDVIGYRSEDMVGMPVTGLVDDIKSKISHNKMSLVDFRTKVKTASGESIQVSTNGTNIRNSDGKTIGYVISMRDMRSMDKIIERLQYMKDELVRSTKELQKFNEQMSGRQNTLVELKAELTKLENA